MLRHSLPARQSMIACTQSPNLVDHDRAKAAALANQPLLDNLGSPVGQNLADAAALVDAIVQRVESNVSGVETRSATEVGLATRADGDLSVAERLARELGSNVNRASQLRADLVARRDLEGVAKPRCRTARRARTDRCRTPSDVRQLGISRRAAGCVGRDRSVGSRPRRSMSRQDRAGTVARHPIGCRAGPVPADRRAEVDAVVCRARRDGTRRRQGTATGSRVRRGASALPTAARRSRRSARFVAVVPRQGRCPRAGGEQ